MSARTLSLFASSSPDPRTRPSRIPAWGMGAVFLLLGINFLSGIAVWYGQTVQAEQLQSPGWLRPALVLHGCMFPVQCVLFGILLAHHIRVGWQLRANLLSGFAMEAVFAGLIVTGAGLYYVGDEDWRERLVWAHRVLGLCLPLTLGLHGLLGMRWGRRAEARNS
jgi:hypothetical protein